MCLNNFKENAAAPIAAMKNFTIFANGTAGTVPRERKAAAHRLLKSSTNMVDGQALFAVSANLS